MFMVWLMEQEDRDDSVAVLQKTLFKDFNNGCLPKIVTVKDVLSHFLDHHPKHYLAVRDSFALALRAYDKEMKQ